MELGTIEPLTTPTTSRRKMRRVSGSSGLGGGGGNDDGHPGGGGNEYPSPDNFDETTSEMPDKSRVVAWFVILIALMTFGGMMAAYVVIATNGVAEWQPFSLPGQLWISTALLAASSFTLQTARNAIGREEHQKSKNWLIATTVLGGIFISSQLLAWVALASRGLYMRGNPYAGFFYILTAAHAIHVLGGIVALGAIQIRAWHPSTHPDELKHRTDLARSVTWYWHFLGVLWIALIGLLAFWK